MLAHIPCYTQTSGAACHQRELPAATWKPRTDWKACDVVDPTHLSPTTFRMDALSKEVQEERDRQAARLKVQAKLATLGGSAPDPRDGGGTG